MAVINSKTTARIAAIQALYQFEMNGRTDSVESLTNNIQQSYIGEDFKELFDIPENISMKLHNTYCAKLISTTIENLEKLDEVITLHLVDGWKYSNLHFSMVALLRVAITEILYCPDTPSKVVINEFTNIGSSLAKQSEVAFINSLLDKLCKEYRNEQ
jgi:N utilization substance protein B